MRRDAVFWLSLITVMAVLSICAAWAQNESINKTKLNDTENVNASENLQNATELGNSTEINNNGTTEITGMANPFANAKGKKPRH